MITEGQQRAICHVQFGNSRGTGFLVAPDAVLTAAHVVKSADGKGHYAGDIKLTFGGAKRVVVEGARVDATQFDLANDWALIRLPQATRLEATPLQGFRVPADASPSWETFGYSKRAKKAGKAYGGHVVTAPPGKFQVRITSTKDHVAGLSGSPCLVDGHVVGIVVESDDDDPADSLYVRPSQEIMCSALTMLASEAPYTTDTQTWIGQFAPHLPPVAVELGLAQTLDDVGHCFKDGRLVKRCALAMMGGVDPTLQALSIISGACIEKWETSAKARIKAEGLLELASRVWIPSSAVQRLAQCLKTADKLIVLNSDQFMLAESYLHRAACISDPSPGKYRIVHVGAGALDDDEWLNLFNEAVLAHPNLRRDDGTKVEQILDEHPHGLRPIVALLEGLPEPTAIQRIRDAGPGYEQVRLVLLVGHPSPPKLEVEYPNVEVIAPAPEPQQVASEAKKYAKSRNDLRQVFT